MSILEHYQAIKKKHHQLPKLMIGKCRVNEEIIETLTTLNEKIQTYEFDQGWLCYQSNIIKLEQTESISAQTEEGGVLLYGELANSQQSLHIRQHLQGTWKLTTLQEITSDSAATEAEKYLSEDLQFIAMPDGEQEQVIVEKETIQQYLNYRRYSKQIEDNGYGKGYQVYAARFIGFNSSCNNNYKKDEE